MEQLKKLFTSLSLNQKITLGIAAVLVVAALYAFTSWRRESDFKPLYTGIAPEEAGAVIQKIKESGSEYRLSETGGVISVPSAKVAELRLELAAAGLPKTGRIGFELFDKANFGATEFVEHINYNRALEGELERSIGSLSVVDTARVHITPAKDSIFIESREPGKASVVVGLRPGAMLLPPNVAAIQQLVSSAVDGVNPEDVSVVDRRGNLLSRRKAAHDDAADNAYSYRERLEHDIVAKINGTLEPLLGRDRFHADAAVECDLTTSDQDEETLDPSKSVMLTSQKSEEVIAGANTAGIPGTATNLPRPPARNGGPTTSTSRRSENITYQSSRLERKTHIPEGQIKRISVSVLLDQRTRWEGKGNARKLVAIPTAPETLKAVRDLVAGVTGFSQERGDQITVEALPFETNSLPDGGADGTPAAAKPFSWKSWKELLHSSLAIGAAGGMIFMLLLGGAAVVFVKRRKKAPGSGLAPGQAALNANSPREKTLEDGKAKPALGGAAAGSIEASVSEAQKNEIASLAALRLPNVNTKKADLLANELRESTRKDPNASANILQTWLREE